MSVDSRLGAQLAGELPQSSSAGKSLCPSAARRGSKYGWGGCPSTVLLLSELKDQHGKHRTVPERLRAAKCSAWRDLIAIVICDSNRESQITSRFETV